MPFVPSEPGRGRRTRAASVFLFFAVTGSLIRLSRPDFGLVPVLAPLDFDGTAPNFIVCAGTPFLVFLSKETVRLSDYSKTALATAAGLSVYELLQTFMPRRTFDPGDIAASFLGALFSIGLAAVLFLRAQNK